MLDDKQGTKMASRERGAPIFSEYYEQLEGPEKKRYKEKVYLCGFDPYTLKRSDFEDNVALFPGIEYPDIVNYLVVQTSWLTHQQMKAYKSLNAYNFFVSGWVNGVLAKELEGDKVLLFSRVS